MIMSFTVILGSKIRLLTLFSLCRWRDVKLRCFENADHRTYVDLKVLPSIILEFFDRNSYLKKRGRAPIVEKW
jgi:hypothetical protein